MFVLLPFTRLVIVPWRSSPWQNPAFFHCLMFWCLDKHPMSDARSVHCGGKELNYLCWSLIRKLIGSKHRCTKSPSQRLTSPIRSIKVVSFKWLWSIHRRADKRWRIHSPLLSNSELFCETKMGDRCDTVISPLGIRKRRWRNCFEVWRSRKNHPVDIQISIVSSSIEQRSN